MRIRLTPGQAVTIHGWWRARESLTWGDVLANEALTFAALLERNLGDQDLYLLQPDLQAWIRAGRASLEDCPRMRLWDAHPVRDFHADLADLARMKWTHDTLARTGVGYEDLVAIGLTHQSMCLFNYTLLMWAALGFQRRHAEAIPATALVRLFSMAKVDVLGSLR